MARPKLVLSLLTKDSDYQMAQAADAEKAALRGGFDVEIVFAKNNGRLQIEQLYHFVRAPEKDRPAAVLTMTVLADGLPVVARDAVEAGIGWILLNRDAPYVDQLRAASPRLPVGIVTVDQDEIGRIHARQFRKLLPKGGNVLYVQGPIDSAPAKRRLETLREGINGTGIELNVVTGEWSEESGEKAAASWMRMANKELVMIAAQNDPMAVGAQRAVVSRKPQWASLPVVGCDCLPGNGRKLVDERKLAASVVVPVSAGAAVDLLAQHQRNGSVPPARTVMAPRAYPIV